MTNTLHRQGTRESLARDYIIFATPATGYNEKKAVERRAEFIRIAKKYNPVNTSDYLAVFTDLESLRAVIRELIDADLGISINTSALLDDVDTCCRQVSITRHSIEHSLGVKGQIDRLPSREVLELSTMCGHGLISSNLINKMLELVKLGKLTSAQAAQYLSEPCVCGAFNPTRAEEKLEQLKRGIV